MQYSTCNNIFIPWVTGRNDRDRSPLRQDTGRRMNDRRRGWDEGRVAERYGISRPGCQDRSPLPHLDAGNGPAVVPRPDPLRHSRSLEWWRQNRPAPPLCAPGPLLDRRLARRDHPPGAACLAVRRVRRDRVRTAARTSVASPMSEGDGRARRDAAVRHRGGGPDTASEIVVGRKKGPGGVPPAGGAPPGPETVPIGRGAYSAASIRGCSCCLRSRLTRSAVRNATSSACSALRRGSQ